MKLIKTPLRVSFFGGGCDFPEYFHKSSASIIGTSINKYVYISYLISQKKNDFNYKIFYKNVEKTNTYENIKLKPLKYFFHKYRKINNIEMHIITDMPNRSGLGSSSAFSVSLIRLKNNFYKQKNTKKSLAQESYKFETRTLKEFVGLQDQILSSYGGLNNIILSKDKFLVNDLSKYRKFNHLVKNNLFLVDTYFKRIASDIESKKFKNFSNINSSLNEINYISKKALNYIKKDKYTSYFPELLNASWNLKKNLNSNVTNQQINEIFNKGISCGATGAKLLGAGGGGFILFYVPSNKQIEFTRSFKGNCIKLGISNEGCTSLDL